MTHEEGHQQLQQAIAEQGLGPVVSCEFSNTGNPDFPVQVLVLLDQHSPTKVETLERWMDDVMAEVWDVTAGRFNARDRVVRLNLRGQTSGGTALVVSVPFDERTEPAETTLIDEQVEYMDPFTLVAALSALTRR